MQTLMEHLQEKFSKAFQGVGADPDFTAEITVSTQEKFGHYQCNSAMSLAKKLGKNPREVAAEVVKQLECGDEIDSLDIAGPGFINIWLQPQFLAEELMQVSKDAYLGADRIDAPEKVIVEYSSPNIAKALHVGHLRSTIIGDALANLFEFLGYDVLRLNHVGDWGTSFGMLIHYLKMHRGDIDLDKTSSDELLEYYQAAKGEFDASLEFKKASQLEVVKLQGGDRENIEIWKAICATSRSGFQEIYDLLDVEIEERGESFYNNDLKEVVADFERKGLITLSDGAKCVFMDEFTGRDGKPLPLMIEKSDGAANYSTTDIAAVRQRVQVEGVKRAIYVVDLGQSLHFNMAFAAAKRAGYITDKESFDHAGFGLVLNEEGKKIKTREGKTIKLLSLIEEAIARAGAIIDERLPDASPDERHVMARTLGVAALKYADLSVNRKSDYIFSFDKMLKFDGNTAVFLIYSFVRIQSILRRKKIDPALLSKTPINLTHPSEISLALHIRRFSEALKKMESDLLPNILTEYLYALAGYINAFHRDCKVIGEPQECSRLHLISIAGSVLKQGLAILGIRTLDRM